MHWSIFGACLASLAVLCPAYGQIVVGGGPNGQGVILPQYPPGPSNNIIPMKFQIEDEAYDSEDPPFANIVYDTFREIGTSAIYTGDLNGLVAFSSMVFHMFHVETNISPTIAGIWDSLTYRPLERLPHNDDGFCTDVFGLWVIPPGQSMNKSDRTFIPGLFSKVGVPTSDFSPGLSTDKMISNFFVISNESYSTYTITNLAAESKTVVPQFTPRPSMLPAQHVQFCIPDNSFIEPASGSETWHARLGIFARHVNPTMPKPTHIYLSIFDNRTNSWDHLGAKPIGGGRPYFHELTMMTMAESFDTMLNNGWLDLVTVGNKSYLRAKVSVRFDNLAPHMSTFSTDIWEYTATLPNGPGVGGIGNP